MTGPDGKRRRRRPLPTTSAGLAGNGVPRPAHASHNPNRCHCRRAHLAHPGRSVGRRYRLRVGCRSRDASQAAQLLAQRWPNRDVLRAGGRRPPTSLTPKSAPQNIHGVLRPPAQSGSVRAGLVQSHTTPWRHTPVPIGPVPGHPSLRTPGCATQSLSRSDRCGDTARFVHETDKPCCPPSNPYQNRDGGRTGGRSLFSSFPDRLESLIDAGVGPVAQSVRAGDS